jgi:peptidoglycan/xylan/chitin deacetylase (PgdA/CDA1 family)
MLMDFKMNIRSQARALLVRGAAAFRADQLALSLQKRKGNSRAVVVAVHETPASLETQFREQLEWVSQYFTITTLESFARLWEQGSHFERDAKPLVLFTFDDGRESNYTVAAPLLESFGGRGVFFVVPAFAECPSAQALEFYRTRINPNSRVGDEQWEDWKPMSPAQIADLAARGHAIGSHTLTHQRLVGLPFKTLEQEIGESARKLTSWTSKPVEAFAWTFGWNAVDVAAWEVARRYHRFCFAPCFGIIDGSCDIPSLLWRREIEVRYSVRECRFLYSGLGDGWWNSRRSRLRRLLRPSSGEVSSGFNR